MAPESPKLSLVRGADNNSKIQRKRSVVEKRQDYTASNRMWREETSSGIPAEETMGRQGAIQRDELGQMSLSPTPTGERSTVVACVHQEQVTRAVTASATMKQLLLCSQP